MRLAALRSRALRSAVQSLWAAGCRQSSEALVGWGRRATLALIRFYQACLSPVLPSSCRYSPSCSAYAYEAVEKWGVFRGVALAARRVLSCRPFAGHGYDPVP